MFAFNFIFSIVNYNNFTCRAFFTRWWAEQTEEKKSKVRYLVQNGQFEFINGGKESIIILLNYLYKEIKDG